MSQADHGQHQSPETKPGAGSSFRLNKLKMTILADNASNDRVVHSIDRPSDKTRIENTDSNQVSAMSMMHNTLNIERNKMFSEQDLRENNESS